MIHVHTDFPEAAFLAPNITLYGDISLGADTSIWYGAVIRADKDTISIGERSNIQDNCVVHTSAGHPIRVGTDVSVGHGAILHGCTIGNQVLVGMGAIILNGADIGDGCIIGAGALVSEGKKIPPRSLVIGLPGKIVREVSDEDLKGVLRNATSYVELARRHAGE